jgi:hypothetical protein
MSQNIQYPDGVDITTSRPKFLGPMLAPELTAPQKTGNDLSWVAGPGGAKGYQPITSTAPNADYAGISPMSPDAPVG